jgi:hypothetical protein
MPTISPFYKNKGVYNPYYNINDTINNNVLRFLKKEYNMDSTKIKYKCVERANREWKNIYKSRGSYIFQIEFFDTVTKEELLIPYYIVLPGKSVNGHYGTSKMRKDSTASSNVNEFLSLYFLKHPIYSNAKDFMVEISEKTGKTGIYTGEENEVTYPELVNLIDADESPERDIEIGYKNSEAVSADLNNNDQHTDILYWTPRKKPGGVHKNNPSDIIIKTTGGCYIGYSNKIASGGKDETPKFNTNMYAFFGKMGDSSHQKKSEMMMNESWKVSVKKVKKNSLSRKKLDNIDITKEAPSESISRELFGELGNIFNEDGLDFFKNDFYYNYREELINSMISHVSKKNNLVYFLNTIGFYTFGVTTGTPCPYKLLVGRPTGNSTIKEVTKNEEYRELLENEDSKNLKKIKTSHVKGTQSFKVSFDFFHHKVDVPITMRTRARGGWSGKSLYITSSGIIMT